MQISAAEIFYNTAYTAIHSNFNLVFSYGAQLQTAGMPTDLKSYIGIAVRAAREQKGWTQERLAEAVDKATETISNIERGFSLPGLATLESLAGALEMPVRVFLPERENYETVSVDRLRKEQELRDLLERLPDGDLDVALGQIRVLAARR